MLLSDFHFDLPQELIAQEPLPLRDASRMLRLRRSDGHFEDRLFRDLPGLLRKGDLLVFNNTRVLPARLFGRRSGHKAQPVSDRNPASKEFLLGKVEVLLTKELDNGDWQALVRPGRKIGIGEELFFYAGNEEVLTAEVIARGDFGERNVRFPRMSRGELLSRISQVGHVPLPPYISRDDSSADKERYQTVFSREDSIGAVAAPTAGLHFTQEILDQIRQRGIEAVEVTLHVGLGTFQPLRHDRVEDNKLHTERYEISEQTAAAIGRAKAEKRRVVAIGTTTVRTLEYAALRNGDVIASSGEADIFIYPGFQFRVIDALLTNFHLPQSSLLMLVSAFAGREQTLAAYRHGVSERYRFFSYGDCMFIE
jgi:S-adenosylmethionine:tRNA ribosyltransferase-isomerase